MLSQYAAHYHILFRALIVNMLIIHILITYPRIVVDKKTSLPAKFAFAVHCYRDNTDM